MNKTNNTQVPSGTSTYKQIIILRKDLNMRKGKMVAQGAHASMKAILDMATSSINSDGKPILNIPMDDSRIANWLSGKFAKITVSIDSEQELLELHKKAQSLNLICALILDSGLTEFGGVPTYTALAIGPDNKDVLDPLTGHLKLL